MVDREGMPREISNVVAWLAAALAIAIVFLATWFPADSVEVERGEALWILPLSLVALGATLFAVDQSFLATSLNWLRSLDRVDLIAIAMVLWMGVAALWVKGVGDFRAALNEWWWWVAAGSFWIASRRLGGIVSFRNRGIALVIGLTVAQATLAAHQYLITLPADRERFLADPDRHLAVYGIVAPEGSAERELFVARLFEGGPTGSFALANSLAGYLVLGLLLALGILWVRRREPAAWLLIGAIGLVGVVLWWTHSRSAMLAVGVGIGWSLGVPWIARGFSRRGSVGHDSARSFLVGRFLVGLGVFALICALSLSFFLAAFSSTWDLFPRSLAFRFQYWQSTFAISAQHPWVGIGPGNFQDTYPSYRLDEASEGIADPHHWFMETLAAGGWPAATLLVILLGLCIQQRSFSAGWRFQSPFQCEEPVKPKSVGFPLRWTAVVACLGSTVWAVQFWIAIGAIPDPDGLFLGAVAGGLSGWGIWRFISPNAARAANKTEGASHLTVDCFANSWATGAVVAVLVHWMAAGGWTIPGNAIPWLLVTGMLVPSVMGGAAEKSSESSGARTPRSNVLTKGSYAIRNSLGVVAALLTISILWYVTAQSKVAEARRWQATAIQLLERGQLVDATDAFAMAARVDPWDPKLSLREAEGWYWRLLRSGDTDAARAGWRKAIEEATGRNPRAYQVHEVSGGQAMVLYQSYGKPSDLQFAKEAYTQVVNLAPGEIRSVAQLVVLALVQGDRSPSDMLTERLEYLSGAGGHSVRELSKVMVWVGEFLGEGAARVGGVKRSVEAEIERLGSRE